MTKEDIIKAYCWIRENNQSIPDDVLDLMKYSAIEKLNYNWIKIESEADLPKDGWHWTLSIIENEPFQTHYEDIDIRYHTHYQPIQKPQPPIY